MIVPGFFWKYIFWQLVFWNFLVLDTITGKAFPTSDTMAAWVVIWTNKYRLTIFWNPTMANKFSYHHWKNHRLWHNIICHYHPDSSMWWPTSRPTAGRVMKWVLFKQWIKLYYRVIFWDYILSPQACQTTKEDILVGLEDIDDNVDEIGISMVTTKDVKYARKLGIQKLPCVGLFRWSQPAEDLNSFCLR